MGKGKYEWGRGRSEKATYLKMIITGQVGGNVRLKLG